MKQKEYRCETENRQCETDSTFDKIETITGHLKCNRIILELTDTQITGRLEMLCDVITRKGAVITL